MTAADDKRRYQRLLVAAIDAEIGPRRWSRKYLAERAGINSQTLDRIFNLKRDMNVIQFDAIAAALGVTPSYLVAKAEEWREKDLSTGYPDQDRLLNEITDDGDATQSNEGNA